MDISKKEITDLMTATRESTEKNTGEEIKEHLKRMAKEGFTHAYLKYVDYPRLVDDRYRLVVATVLESNGFKVVDLPSYRERFMFVAFPKEA